MRIFYNNGIAVTIYAYFEEVIATDIKLGKYMEPYQKGGLVILDILQEVLFDFRTTLNLRVIHLQFYLFIAAQLTIY